MKRIFRKSFIFITLLTVIMLSSVFLLPSMLFADTTTFTAIGDENYGIRDGGWWPEQIKYHFDVTGIKLSEIKKATLRVWSETVDFYAGEIDEVYYEGNYLGVLRDYSDSFLTEFDVDPSFIVLGQNDVVVIIDAVSQFSWYCDVNNSELVIVTEKEEQEPEPPVWVRPMPMTVWQVFINEDNDFQFIFWYPYKDKNWVRIYDMDENMVHETDLPVHDPNLIVDLPDGFYMVRTYHGEVMLQEFLIGKP